MAPNLLILGGTAEASLLAARVAACGISATFSYAGRVARPDAQPIPIRVGGFGGPDGLAAYLTTEKITHLIDATHPFAAQISRNAITASATADVPLMALTRAPWTKTAADRWTHAPDINSAGQSLDPEPKRIFLAIGRTDVAAFKTAPQHHYLLRYVDAPEVAPPLPHHDVLVARGPFDRDTDRALLEQHRIDLIVSKNSGGSGARAKIDAARELGLPVLMIERPHMPPRAETHSIDEVITWIAHPDTERGV